ncbi:helix-turn-helix domain-containing protein [Candidatus Peregrinibacteria bacterium]|nr:helix-turn-helix domain-containing protein [Candidatus Peregrinibacteria bacterium]
MLDRLKKICEALNVSVGDLIK